jgi:transposase-like protein
MSSQRSARLTGAELQRYKAECTIRSKAFRRDVLAYHRRYPTVFIKARRAGGQPLAKWLESMIERQGETLVARPRRFCDVQVLSGTEAQLEAFKSGRVLLRPTDGPMYFQNAKLDVVRWRADRALLADRWPWVPSEVIEAPGPLTTDALRQPVIAMDSDGRLAILPSDDWTERDVVNVFRLGRRSGLLPKRQSRRPRSSTVWLRLRVFDEVEQHGSVSRAAATVGISTQKARRLYETACLDIEGRTPPRRGRKKPTAAQLRRQLAEVRDDSGRCSKCRHLGRLCLTHAASMDAVELVQGRLGRAEPLTSSGDVDYLQMPPRILRSLNACVK